VCVLSAALSRQQWLPIRLNTKPFRSNHSRARTCAPALQWLPIRLNTKPFRSNLTCGCHSLTLMSRLRLQFLPGWNRELLQFQSHVSRSHGGGAAPIAFAVSSWLESRASPIPVTCFTVTRRGGGAGYDAAGLTSYIRCSGGDRAAANYDLQHVPAA
jgi:hypothetical protein